MSEINIAAPGEAIATEAMKTGRWLIDRIFPDKIGQERERREAELALYQFKEQNERSWFQLFADSDKGQVEINVADAQSGSFFRGGWRPATGWVCVAGFAIMVILNPLMTMIAPLAGIAFVPLILDTNLIMGTLLPLLGLGAYRTYERVRGKA